MISNGGIYQTLEESFFEQTLVGSGGTITTVGDYTVHTFTTSGTFTFEGGGTIEYLVVGGGGAGGDTVDSYGSGGGGGGQVLTGSLFLNSPKSISIIVGAGGNGANPAGAPPTLPQNGSPSSISGYVTAIGGYANQSDTNKDGANSGNGYIGGTSNGGSGGGGGGAGAGANGNSGGLVSQPAGSGGSGIASSINGTTTYYGGGGGGGHYQFALRGSGGQGGGGTGASETAPKTEATPGQPNTGGGGGGNTQANINVFTNTKGGSGIVIIRYLTVN